MENFDNNKTQVLKYLKGEMSPTQQQEFENELAANAELKETVEDIALFNTGLEIMDKLEKDHVGSELLSLYAMGNLSRDNNSVLKIEKHLDGCEQCRQLLDLSKLTIKKMEDLPNAKIEGLFERFFNYLFTPKFSFRPIYAPILLLLLSAPIYLSMLGNFDRIPIKASYEITESIERNVDGTGFIVIKDKTEIIELRFIVPVIDLCLYNFNLYDAEGNLVFVKPNNKPQKVFALQLPTTYLPNGNYTLVVDELRDGKIVPESFRFPFSVNYSE